MAAVPPAIAAALVPLAVEPLPTATELVPLALDPPPAATFVVPLIVPQHWLQMPETLGLKQSPRTDWSRRPAAAGYGVRATCAAILFYYFS